VPVEVIRKAVQSTHLQQQQEMEKTDTIAMSAEDTFEDQVRGHLFSAYNSGRSTDRRARKVHLVPEPERAPYVPLIRQRLAVEEGQTPLSGDVAGR